MWLRDCVNGGKVSQGHLYLPTYKRQCSVALSVQGACSPAQNIKEHHKHVIASGCNGVDLIVPPLFATIFKNCVTS